MKNIEDINTKYPRTYHLPWSPGATSDDKKLSPDWFSADGWAGKEIVITEKLDGENTAFQNGDVFSRSHSVPTRSPWSRNLWDGEFKNGVYFENKNVSASAKSPISFSLKFQDTSDEKLEELKEGVICSTSFFDDSKVYPGFIMVGNTRNVGDLLEMSYNPATRKSCQVSMPRCLKHGFKIVTWEYDKKTTWDIITTKFPRLGTIMSIDDIYTKKDLPGLVADMM